MNEQQEDATIMAQAQAAILAQQAQAGQLNTSAYAQAQQMEKEEKGLAEEQLDLTEELERIEHLLRGHLIKRDSAGIPYWDDDVDEKMQPLNEYGIRRIMKILNMYLCKRKLLSNYTAEQVMEKMEDFATELCDLIFMEYREMGLDTSDKKKMYSMLCRELQDAVHDVYNRALNGKERESIRKHWSIQETMGGVGENAGGKPNPLSWLRR